MEAGRGKQGEERPSDRQLLKSVIIREVRLNKDGSVIRIKKLSKIEREIEFHLLRKTTCKENIKGEEGIQKRNGCRLTQGSTDGGRRF
jgi:hypothetical protein